MSRYDTMPPDGGYTDNPVQAQTISNNQTFQAIANESAHMRQVQRMRWQYIYGFSDSIVGQQTSTFSLTIEQGTDFKSEFLTASAFSYDAGNATDFPIPNAIGSTAWAGRGLNVKITDSNSGRTLTSGEIPIELIAAPGYGLNFQHPYPFKYYFYRNNKINFDIRNRDNSDRTHDFAFALLGYKLETPQ